MAIKLTNDMRNALLNGPITNNLGNSTLRVYSGSAPSTANAAPSGTLLVEITGIYFDAPNNGTAPLTSTYLAEATVGGIAGYARLLDTYGTSVAIQGNVGTAATCDFVISKGTFGIENVTLTLATLIQPAE